MLPLALSILNPVSSAYYSVVLAEARWVRWEGLSRPFRKAQRLLGRACR
jgi:hypothetical protein